MTQTNKTVYVVVFFAAVALFTALGGAKQADAEPGGAFRVSDIRVQPILVT